ncbi:hypothetical protein BDZ97DRAFT_1998599 [Flammula alnicola]|nr:hypothetical protein BDZ97DRAFT_1998599 [Flammula alnicola]
MYEFKEQISGRIRMTARRLHRLCNREHMSGNIRRDPARYPAADSTTTWQRTDTLSVDAAIGIFSQSGLSFKQIREIWTIADRDGSGKLTKNELAVVIRLAGWVQSGAEVHEDLLSKAGPLPALKGVTEVVGEDKASVSSSKQELETISISDFIPAAVPTRPLNAASRPVSIPFNISGLQQIPPINLYDVQNFKRAFDNADPVHGLLDLLILLQKKQNLLQTSQRSALNFCEFSLGMHLLQGLQSCSILTLPPKFPQDLHHQLEWILSECFGGTHNLKSGRSALNSPYHAKPACAGWLQSNENVAIIQTPLTASTITVQNPIGHATSYTGPVKEASQFTPDSHTSPSKQMLEQRGLSALWARVVKRYSLSSVRKFPTALAKGLRSRGISKSAPLTAPTFNDEVLISNNTTTSSTWEEEINDLLGQLRTGDEFLGVEESVSNEGHSQLHDSTIFLSHPWTFNRADASRRHEICQPETQDEKPDGGEHEILLLDISAKRGQMPGYSARGLQRRRIQEPVQG